MHEWMVVVIVMGNTRTSKDAFFLYFSNIKSRNVVSCRNVQYKYLFSLKKT